MAELSSIGFRIGTGRLHRLDPRFKLGALALLSTAAAAAEPAGLSLLFLLVLAGIRDTRLSLLRLAAETRMLLIMLALAAVLRAIVSPDSDPSGLAIIGISRHGLVEGLTFAWRVLVMATGGALLSATTRTRDLRTAVIWLLRPLPGVPARRLATMMGLVVRFIPEILHQAAEIRDAQRSRGIDACRNPVRRLALFIGSLMRRTLLRADHLALAMAARGYSEKRTDVCLAAKPADALMLTTIAVICLTAIVW